MVRKRKIAKREMLLFAKPSGKRSSLKDLIATKYRRKKSERLGRYNSEGFAINPNGP